MAKKKYDLAVKIGSYQKDGKEKPKYKNIGVVMQKDDGGQFMLLDPLINLAAIDRGVDNNGNPRETVIVSMFEPRDNDAPAKRPTEYEE